MFDEMKCPVCDNPNYEVIDTEPDIGYDGLPSITWLCFCPDCKSYFNIYAKMRYESIEYLNIVKEGS